MALVVGFSGSPRPDGNTHFLVKEALAAAEATGAEVRFHDLNATPVQGCQACMACKEPGHEGRCAVDDAFTAMHADLQQAEAIIFGAPVYIAYWSGQAKNFIDRWYCFRSRTAYHFPPIKRAVMVCTCGAGAASYQDLLDKQLSWMGDRLGMDARGLMAASLSGKDAASRRPELVSEAKRLGNWLATGQDG